MKTTFNNGFTTKQQKQVAKSHLKSRADFIKQAMAAEDLESVGDERQSFYEYGLSFDYVAPETFNDQLEGYHRFQLSWGGPSDEIRFYSSPGSRKPYRVEYVFMDWGTGIGFDVSAEDWAQWLWDWFYDCGSVAAEIEKAAE